MARKKSEAVQKVPGSPEDIQQGMDAIDTILEEVVPQNGLHSMKPNEHPGVVASPLETKTEDFYNQADSVYLRIKYVPEVRGYKFEVWNQLFQSLQNIEDLNDDHRMMMTLARGLAEIIMINPQQVYDVGQIAQNRDFIHHNDGLTDEQKKLFSNPQGVA